MQVLNRFWGPGGRGVFPLHQNLRNVPPTQNTRFFKVFFGKLGFVRSMPPFSVEGRHDTLRKDGIWSMGQVLVIWGTWTLKLLTKKRDSPIILSGSNLFLVVFSSLGVEKEWPCVVSGIRSPFALQVRKTWCKSVPLR